MMYLNYFRRAIIFSLIILCFPLGASAQNEGPAVLQWRSFLPYNQVVDFAYNDNTFYCATTSGFFTYNRADGMMEAYSKTNGMHDVGLSGVAYDADSKCAVLAYGNSNIDLLQHHQFYNIPDVKSSQINGDKSIYDVIAQKGTAYLSTGIGLVLLNLEKKEIKGTVVFYDSSLTAPVFATAIINNEIYAATGVGLFRSPADNTFLQNYATWDKLSDQTFHYLTVYSGNLYAAEADSIYNYSGSSVQFFKKAANPVVHLDGGPTGIWVSSIPASGERGTGYLVDGTGNVMDSIPCRTPSKIISLGNGETWYGDESNYGAPLDYGLRKKTSATGSTPYFPKGPIVSTSFDIDAYDGDLWVAHGGYGHSWGSWRLRAMFSHYTDGEWKNYPWVSDSEWVQDFDRVLRDPNTGKVYLGSFSGGLLIMNADGSWKVYGDGYLPDFYGSGTGGSVPLHFVSGMALDDAGNLWISNYGGSNELTVKTPDGQWYNSKQVLSNNGNPPHSAADVLIDDYGQKWFIAPTSGAAIVYDDKGTLSNNSDDVYRVLRIGKGNGNLPGNATCIAKDKDGAIWIGTDNGIGIVNCPGSVISGDCEASLKIVQFDQFADYLFVKQIVRAIAVDGANRKWVGTANGVWLISADGEKVIYRFTSDNSPLPSDFIQRINIDPVTGDVYFSTDKGIVSFRSTATEGKTENEEHLLIYPNPVPSGYQGMIAVRGVADGADVRFTDISGQLVYRTTALGGQAVWNGKDYTGHKVETGVYLVFVVSKDGTQKTTGKFILYK
jgi:hypothetical protein